MSAPSPPPPPVVLPPGATTYTPSPLHPHDGGMTVSGTTVAPPVAGYSLAGPQQQQAVPPNIGGVQPPTYYYSQQQQQPGGVMPQGGQQPVYVVRPTAVYYDANGLPVQYVLPPGAVPTPYGAPPPGGYYPQQPGPQQNQVVYVVDGQPPVINAADPPIGQWRDDLFGCFENIAPSCLMSWCCNCVALGQIANRLNERYLKYQHIVPFFVGLYILYFVFDLLAPRDRRLDGAAQVMGLIIGILLFLVTYRLRGVMRQRYRIPGDECTDCLTTFCCQCCAISQMMRHIFYYRTSCEDCPMGPEV